MFLGLRTAGYHVNDLEKAKEWYSEVLGKKPYFDEPFYVGFNVGGYELGLIPAEEEIVLGNNLKVYWGVPNVIGALTHLVAKGAAEHESPQDVGGGIIVATVLDPFGNIFGIIENPHFKLES